MGPKNRRTDDDKSFENSGEQFQNDLDELYGQPEETQDSEDTEDEQKRK